ncbi:hypothetical protein [Oceanibaculum indicum]|uniref:Phage tail protein n=1 Tax=Oceanibaculum indicum P24 TaxID=1207063 RepID=K2JK01_9PROT|nr:hypothetical protein [Oceanibaculum indicum]EKE70894.1 hypothetical protein P24_15164 [Oceanibaculum indicum P24]
MSSFRTKNVITAAKVQAEVGTDAAPTVGDDAFLCEAVSANPSFENEDTDESTGVLDDRPSIAGGGFRPFDTTVHLKGSGSAGTAPEFAALLIGCAMAEYLLAADLVGTATAGTSSTVSVPDITGVRAGMVLEITDGTGEGQRRVITGVTAGVNPAGVLAVYPDFETDPDETSEITVRACALYVPASTSLKNITLRRWQKDSAGGNSKLTSIVDAAGTANFTFAPRVTGKCQFQMRGRLSAPTDVADPGAPSLTSVRPVALVGAEIFLGGVATRFNQLTFNLGATVDQQDDPSDAYGYGEAGVTRRRMEGRINPPMALQSVRNAFASWLNGTTQAFWLNYGPAAGNRISLYAPELVYTGDEDEDVRGFAHSGLPFRAGGQDSGVHICFW